MPDLPLTNPVWVMTVAGLLHPDRVRLDLDGDDLATVFGALLQRLHPAGRGFDATLRALVEDDVGYATELLPGALVAHARAPPRPTSLGSRAWCSGFTRSARSV